MDLGLLAKTKGLTLRSDLNACGDNASLVYSALVAYPPISIQALAIAAGFQPPVGTALGPYTVGECCMPMTWSRMRSGNSIRVSWTAIVKCEEGGKPPGVKGVRLNGRWQLRSITTNSRQLKVANRLLSESGANWDGVGVRLTAFAARIRRKLPLWMRREMANLEAGTKPTCR